ncbi:MAG: FAD-binding protein [Kiritimatiellae bacterium]|nr:FAD-binding protein [Kiritimatiellia bacterium]MCO5068869.1 FAD-binding protein [Kiritimatiellia bacterium]
MTHEPASGWREEFAKIVGDTNVLASAEEIARAEANVTGLHRRVAALVRPASTAEVQRLVQAAIRFHVPLYPYSRGCNWGLGSRLPVRDGACLVDLSRMNRIREVNARHRYAVVEPGVTQQQLYEYIVQNRLPLMINVIGAGGGTSMLGNALERGIGYFSSRAGTLSGMEVVLGNGTLLRTGFGDESASALTHIYKHGVGPGLDGLFYQSNFGIVTAAGIELLPQQPCRCSVIAKIRDAARLPELVNILGDLRRRDVIRMVTHIGNVNRTFDTLAPLVYEQLGPNRTREQAEALLAQEGFGPWSAVSSVAGEPEEVRHAVGMIRRALRGVASVAVLDDARLAKISRLLRFFSFLPAARRKASVLRAVMPVYGLSQGIPTDEPLKALYWGAGLEPPSDAVVNPDWSEAGYLYVLPLFPLDGAVAGAVAAEAERRAAARGFKPAMTFNIMDERCLELVLSISFPRSQPERAQSAQAFADEILDVYAARGFRAYRVGVHQMGRVVRAGDPFWETARAIKRTLDPHDIIAPGRYSLD